MSDSIKIEEIDVLKGYKDVKVTIKAVDDGEPTDVVVRVHAISISQVDAWLVNKTKLAGEQVEFACRKEKGWSDTLTHASWELLERLDEELNDPFVQRRLAKLRGNTAALSALVNGILDKLRDHQAMGLRSAEQFSDSVS